jgi:PPM family protein phosphatase
MLPQMSDAVPDAPRQPLDVAAFGLTDIGCVRESNEDQFLVADLAKTMRIRHTSLPEPKMQFGNERGHLFLVADGMGGHAAGEYASAMAVTAIEQFTLNTFKWFFHPGGADAQRVLTQFQSALRAAEARIFEESSEHPELRGMGTTVTMAYQLDSQLCIVHAGDSRAYMFENGELAQVTRDHTVVAELVRQGSLQPGEAARHRFRNLITNVVGGNEALAFVESHALQLQAGDRLLLCSDGLTEMLSNDAIAATLRDEPDPEGACRKLVRQANDAGGRDNITVVIARFDAGETRAGGSS